MTGTKLIRWLLVINLALVALQPVSAGFILSGWGSATAVHRVVGLALQVGVVVQAAAALMLWLRRRLPGWVPGVSAGLLLVVFLQIGLGFNDWHWLHVPVGVGIVGFLPRQLTRLSALKP
jgi:hypothetical protein